MQKDSTAVKQQSGITDKNIEAYQGEDAENAEMELIRVEETVQIFGTGLQALFDKQVGLKEELEQRWLDDLRHYNGKYDREQEAKMSSAGAAGSNKKNQSKIFVNLTRSKSNVAESKWSDLVLPTDDRNWGLKPTPVPSLVSDLNNDEQVTLTDGSLAVNPDDGEPYSHADVAKEVMDAAKTAAESMQTEIDDQLTEAKYNSVCRDIIHDAVVMGLGIIKGPMVQRSKKTAWIEDAGDWVMKGRVDYIPTAARVDPWNFFPDMSAIKWEDTEFVFERHLLTRKQLRQLAKQPGYMPNQIRNILNQSANARASKLTYLNELREINGITQVQNDNRYEVLEYHGPIEKSNLIACGCEGVNETDPMEEIEGTVWFSMGTVIKVSLNHMDSEELPYNVLNWEKDETSIFGFGVPYRMRAPQRVMNASWRMVLDNAGLSTGPQILINKEVIEPADGVWALSPRKIWWMKTKDNKFRADYAMKTFDINSHQAELTAIFEMAHRLADEETNVPQQQMGGQPGDVQQPAMLKTLGGTALWMSANNIMMRRAVKNFDDDITTPVISRFYDWNMQFNKKSEIKGDYSIDVRGTSVLLVREMQARNIQEFIDAAMAMPGGASELKVRGVLKNMAKGMQVSVDDVMRTDDDVKAEEARQKEEGAPPDPEMMKLELQREIAQMNMDEKAMEMQGMHQIKLMEREISLMKIASNENISLEKIRDDNQIKKYNKDWDIRQFYEELAEKRRTGPTGNYGLGE